VHVVFLRSEGHFHSRICVIGRDYIWVRNVLSVLLVLDAMPWKQDLPVRWKGAG
jgi:hypothetical protein